MSNDGEVLGIIYYNHGIFSAPKIIIEALELKTSQEVTLAQVEECTKIWQFLPISKKLVDELLDRCNEHATYIEVRLARLRLVYNVRR